MEEPWCEKTWNLKDKCRGRFHWTNYTEIQEACDRCRICSPERRKPTEDGYMVPGCGYMNEDDFKVFETCTIAFTLEKMYNSEGKAIHWYFTAYGHDNAKFVKEFKNNELILTSNLKEAKHFYLDEEVDACMEYIVDNYSPWTIALLFWKGNETTSAGVHFPNEYWGCNHRMQPSLMHKSVSEWYEEHGIKID